MIGSSPSAEKVKVPTLQGFTVMEKVLIIFSSSQLNPFAASQWYDPIKLKKAAISETRLKTATIITKVILKEDYEQYIGFCFTSLNECFYHKNTKVYLNLKFLD